MLTAAMIVRDEAAWLPGCLASIQPLVDEVVLVDTGSVDSTPDIADRFGATVIHHRWTDDFAAARNLALDAVGDGWVLYIDADERVTTADRSAVRQRLGPDSGHAAVAVGFRYRPSYTPFYELRLFRADPDIRFQGAIHETIMPSVDRVCQQRGLTVGRTDDLVIEHLGYEGDQTAKHHRNLPLLLAETERWPDRPYLWHQLGRVRQALGDETGAVEAWERGSEIAMTYSWAQPLDSLSVGDLLEWRWEHGMEVDDLLAEATARFPSNDLLAWLQARVSLAAGRPREAIVLLERLEAVDTDAIADNGLAYPTWMYTVGTWGLLGNCWAALGETEKAADAFARAEQADPANVEVRTKRRLVEARARRT